MKGTGVLGLDIGGANLKAGHSCGVARTVTFALWKEPERLSERIRDLARGLPDATALAVTMTGELCDCFASRREGVLFILQAVEAVAAGRAIMVWCNEGRFIDVEQARRRPLDVAAANWLALAHCAARISEREPGLLLDIGSTTTDIVPLANGQARPTAVTDRDRMRCGELVYTGARRTPVCALLGSAVAAEWFATMLDVYLVLGLLSDNPDDFETADGRPATRKCAHARLAHLLCADGETCADEETRLLAERATQVQTQVLAATIERVGRRMPEVPRVIVVSGSGEFLARRVLAQIKFSSRPRIVSLAERWGAGLSSAACACAVAQLAATHGGGNACA